MTRRLISFVGCVLSLAGITVLIGKSAESHRNARNRALVLAVTEGDWEQTTELLQAGASVHTRTPQGESLLFAADSGRNRELLTALAQRGLSLHDRDGLGLTVLHRAARRGDVETLDTLLKLGQPVDELDGHGRTALSHALRGAHYKAVHLLLERGANARPRSPVEPPLLSLLTADFLSMTPSIPPGGSWRTGPSWSLETAPRAPRPVDSLARYRGRPLAPEREEALLLCVGELLAYRAAPDARDAAGNSPIGIAISRGCWKATRILVEKLGGWRDAEGRTALRLAAELGNSAGVAELYHTRNRPGEGAKAELVLAAWAGDARRTVTLLRAGIDPNESGIPGRTALARATERGDLESVKALLAAGAHPEQCEQGGITPLHLAGLRRRPAVMQALLAAGAPVNARSEMVRTPLHEAAATPLRPPTPTVPPGFTQKQADQVRVVELLLQHGADPSARDHRGATPLQTALSRPGSNSGTIARMLLEHGASVTGSGDTEAPLFAAARIGDIPLAAALLRRGAKINERSRGGGTPLWSATMWGNHDMMRFLCARGAQLPETIRLGENPPGPNASRPNLQPIAVFIRQWSPTDERRQILAAQFPTLAAEIDAPDSPSGGLVSSGYRR